MIAKLLYSVILLQCQNLDRALKFKNLIDEI